jgi:hypothetical protein
VSIQSKQVTSIANNVINKFLQNGTVPSANSVLAAVYAELNSHAPGTPLTTFSPVTAQSQTNTNALNKLVEQIQNDIENLYNENIELVNKIVRDFDYKQTRRERLIQRIVEITANLAAAEASTQQAFQGNIGSFRDIDFSKTSAFVNFKDYCIELPPSSNLTAKVPLSGASIHWSTDGDNTTTLGEPSNILNDLLNEAFFARVLTSKSSATLTITVQLPKPTTISNVIVTGQIGSPASITVQLDNDNLTSQSLDITRRAAWDISSRQVEKITISMVKNASDGMNGTSYYFDFGLKNLSLLNQQYSQSAIFQSMPIQFGKPIGSLTLNASTDIPPNCQIDWSISTTGADGSFKPIASNTPIIFANQVKGPAKRIFPVLSPKSQVRAISLDGSGVATGQTDADLPVLAPIRGSRSPLFALCRVPLDAENIQVRRGKNAWRVLTYHYSVSKLHVAQDPQPTLLDFTSPRGGNQTQVYSRFQPTEFDLNAQFIGLTADQTSALRLPAIEYPFQSQDDRVMHLFEANITVDPTLAPSVLAGLATATIVLPPIFGNARSSIYCNGTLLSVNANSVGNSLQYSCILPLNAGQNLLQIVTNNYISLGGAAFDFGTQYFSSLINKNEIEWWAESSYMTSVSLFELQYQTSRNDFSRYGITEDPLSDNNLIVVRELPTTTYEINSSQLASTAPSQVILRAQLSGSAVQPSLSPKIEGYTLTTTS